MKAHTTTGIATTGEGIQPKSLVQRGFTIVETLIVLAVTGVLFLSIITLISGKQSKTEFNQAINDVKNQLDQTINQASVGFYPNAANFNCAANTTTGKITITPITSGTATPQGSNTGCIFVGKVVHFYSGPDPAPYYVYTLAGSQFDGSGNIITDILQAGAKVVPNNTETNTMEFGLSVSSLKSDTTNIGSFAFISNFGSYSGTDVKSGSSQISLLPIKQNSKLDNPVDSEQTAIEQYLDSSVAGGLTTAQEATEINPAQGVTICLNSGGTNQSGKITVGGNGRALGTTLQIYNGLDCT
jgi:prepilin-type N-terminal cleavage/methylation domain-containing protein